MELDNDGKDTGRLMEKCRSLPKALLFVYSFPSLKYIWVFIAMQAYVGP